VDKILTDIKAVQTLSRLNRAHPGKNDTFVLDFANKPEDIKAAFSTYYKTTLLSDETDPNKLYELISKLEKHEVYTVDTVGAVVSIFLKSASREKIDPLLDGCVVHYKDLDEDAQVAFKGSAKSFVRVYNFLAAILPYSMAQWEKLSIFLTLLIPKLPAPREDDFSSGILRTVDLDSYRAEVKRTLSIRLEDKDVEVDPISLGQPVHESELEYDYLSHIIADFNNLWGSLFKDPEHIAQQVATLPVQVAQNTAWQNAKRNAGKEDARTESNIALNSAMLLNMDDGIELFKQFSDNPSFKAWLQDIVFNTNYNSL
jgi:type I restriction enzyme R subunit